jgi:cullin-associated NEDD8-dissociated protein 1
MSEDLGKLLKDLKHHDPHFRQNSVRFLSQKYINEFKTLKLEDRNSILDGLISKLDKKEDSLEVKGVAVRELGKMAKILKEEDAIKVFSIIISFVTDEKAEGKDIYVLCIKEILKEMNPSSCHLVGKTIIPEIIKGIQHKNNIIKELCFDTFNDYICKFNYILIKDSESLIKNKELVCECALDCLKTDSLVLRKVSSLFLGSFSTILKKETLYVLLNNILKLINSCSENEMKTKINYFNTLTGIAKNTCSKHNEFYLKIYPVILDFSSIEHLKKYSSSSTEDYDSSNELTESVLNLLEIYILKLTNEVKLNIKTILHRLIDLIFYDPNYSYENEENSESKNMDLEAEYNNYDYDYEYGYNDYNNADNEDTSWRVRRAAVRAIQGVIKSRISLEKSLSNTLLEELILALRERDENTKLDIINCLNSIMQSLILVDSDEEFKNFNQISNSFDNKISKDLVLTKRDTSDVSQLTFTKKTSSASDKKEVLSKLILKIIKELENYKSNNNLKLSIVKMAGSLSLLEPNLFLNELTKLSPLIESSFNESTELALAIISLVNKTIKGMTNDKYLIENPEALEEYYYKLFHVLSIGAQHSYYKVNIEAVNCISVLINSVASFGFDKISKIYSELTYSLLLPKFKLNDIDQELKVSLVVAVGYLIIHLGHYLKADYLNTIFEIFYEKNSNENLRSLIFSLLIKTLKSKKIDLSPYMIKYVEYILKHSLKFNIQVQYQSLELLLTILKFASSCVSSQSSLCNSINESVISLANEDSLVSIIYHILIELLSLVKDSNVNKSLLKKTIEVVNSKPDLICPILFDYLEKLVQILEGNDSKAMLQNIFDLNEKSLNSNKAIAISILAIEIKLNNEIVQSCLKTLTSSEDNNQKKWVLQLLGEICLRSQENNKSVFAEINTFLNNTNEELKPSVAVCLGKLSVSNLEEFMKYLTNSSNSLIGFYFISIRECLSNLSVINTKDSKKFKEDKENLLNKLFKFLISYTKHKEDKIKLLSGESIGLLSLVSETLLFDLTALLEDNKEPEVKIAALYSLKYVFSTRKYSEKQLEKIVTILINSLNSEDLKEKSMAYSSLVNFAYNFSDYLRNSNNSELLNIILESFDKNHKYDESLIDKINLGGGITIKNDKGLTIRKSIFTTLKIFLEKLPEKLKFERTITIVIEGLRDNEDIQNIAFSCIDKLSIISPGAFISVIEPIIEILSIKLKTLKSTEDKDGSLAKKLTIFCDETYRFLSDISKVLEIDENPKFNEFKYEIESILK